MGLIIAEISRRNLLKCLGISIPTAWAAPIIEAIMLPAHAQTTGGAAPCGEGWINGDSSSTGQPDDEILLAGLFDTRCECETAVKAQYPKANGANWGFNSSFSGSSRFCYAEFGWVCPPRGDVQFDTKSLEGTDCTD